MAIIGGLRSVSSRFWQSRLLDPCRANFAGGIRDESVKNVTATPISFESAVNSLLHRVISTFECIFHGAVSTFITMEVRQIKMQMCKNNTDVSNRSVRTDRSSMISTGS